MKTKVLDNITPKKALSIGIILLVCAVVVYFFWNKIADAISSAIARNRQQKENQSTYGSPTLTQAQINSIASQLAYAFSWHWGTWNTDEAAVQRLLSQIKTNADYAAVAAAFLASNGKDLDTCLTSEGSEREKSSWRTVLDENGVTIYSF